MYVLDLYSPEAMKYYSDREELITIDRLKPANMPCGEEIVVTPPRRGRPCTNHGPSSSPASPSPPDNFNTHNGWSWCTPSELFLISYITGWLCVYCGG